MNLSPLGYISLILSNGWQRDTKPQAKPQAMPKVAIEILLSFDPPIPIPVRIGFIAIAKSTSIFQLFIDGMQPIKEFLAKPVLLG